MHVQTCGLHQLVACFVVVVVVVVVFERSYIACFKSLGCILFKRINDVSLSKMTQNQRDCMTTRKGPLVTYKLIVNAECAIHLISIRPYG